MLFAIVVFFLGMTSFGESVKQTAGKVLFISSYSYDWESVPRQLDGIHKALSDKTTIRYMFMNTKSFQDDIAISMFYEQMKSSKAHGINYDLVVLGDDPALAFAQKYRKEFFDNVPLVFEGINSVSAADAAYEDPLITGITESFPICDTIRLAQELYPGARRVVGIVDNTLSGQGAAAQFHDAKKYFLDLDFIDMNCSELSRDEIAEQISTYGPETILLYFALTFDKDENCYQLAQAINLLTSHARVPIFNTDEIGVGYGLLGGKVLSYAQMSYDAGKMAALVLSGISPSSIPIAETKEYYLIDSQVMTKYGLSPDKMPMGTTFINDEKSFFEQHKEVIPYAIAVLCVLLVALVVLYADNRRKRSLNKYLQRIAYSDPLTGEYNRAHFCMVTRKMLDDNPSIHFSILRLDLDDFKVFNDVCGTDTGDKLLRYIAQAHAKLETSDYHTYGYLGSDHFVLCLPTNTLDVAVIQRQMQSLLNQFPSPLRIIPCFGIYHIHDKSVPVELMLNRALLALRSVKGNIQNHIGVYDDTIRQRMLEEQSLLTDMERAFNSDEFIVYFQPQYSCEKNTFVGAEALARWNHPTRGVLLPGTFVSLFEKKGLILRLDECIWENACRWLHEWIKAGNMPIRISVNVSRIDIYDKDLCAKLVALRDKYEIPRELMHLEITESAYLDHTHQLIQTVRELQENGFVIEMDDFGSGYSSLNSLKDVPVNVLKMDLKFLFGKDNAHRGSSIVRSVISMGHWLNLKVIAEGVETAEQVDFLRSVGCEYLQGYYFAKPLPVEEFEALLKKNASLPVTQMDPLLISEEELNAFWNPNDRISLLFNSIVGGASIIEYSEKDGSIAVMRINAQYLKELTMSQEFFNERHFHAEKWVHPDSRKTVMEGMKHLLQTGDCEVVECQLQVDVDRYVWIRIRHGVIARIGVVFLFYSVLENIDDLKKQVDEFREKNQILEDQRYELERYRIIVEHTATTIFDFDKYGEKYYHTKSYERYAMSQIPYDTIFSHCSTQETVHPDDREELSHQLRQHQKGFMFTEADLRLQMKTGEYRWTHLAETYINDANGEHVRTVGTLTDINEEMIAKQNLKMANERMANVIANIPVGIGIYELENGCIRPVYFSDLLCSMIGLTPEQYSALMTPCMPESYLKAFDGVSEIIANLKPGRTPYLGQGKFNLKSGRVIWLRLMASFIVTPNKPTSIYVTVIDVTQQVLAEQAEKWKEQRYRILIESTNVMTFDYDPQKDELTYTLMNNGQPRETVIPKYSKYLPNSHVIHKDFLESYTAQLMAAKDKPTSGSFEYLACCYGESNYRWHRAYYVSIGDESGTVYRVFGYVTDIHDERVKLDKLLEKAETDAVTELYNRSTTEELIEFELHNISSVRHAIVELDIDHFKSINDTYGHPVGDMVLRQLADILKRSSRQTDIVGRIGGDEFVLFFCDIKNNEEIVKRVESILGKVTSINEAMADVLRDEVTISIGIAFLDKSFTTFDEAFACVDKALYEAKARGGNCYIVYH